MSDTRVLSAELRNAWLLQARSHPLIAGGLLAAGLAVAALLLTGVVNAFSGTAPLNLARALLGGTAGFVATGGGALLAVALGRMTIRSHDCMLGFTAGMMLAASSFSLILPGLAAGREILGNSPGAALVVAFGLGLGVLLMLGLDYFTPHAHETSGACGPGAERLSRVWLFVLAITLHNLPEGMAIGVGFSGGDLEVALPLTSAIAIQDIPEGLAVALALRGAGQAAPLAVLTAAASGLMEPFGALVGIGLSSGFALAYPVGLGLAAGAMVFVVSHEVIPETHRNGHQTPATLGLMGGFAVMMFLDNAFG